MNGLNFGKIRCNILVGDSSSSNALTFAAFGLISFHHPKQM